VVLEMSKILINDLADQKLPRDLLCIDRETARYEEAVLSNHDTLRQCDRIDEITEGSSSSNSYTEVMPGLGRLKVD
jgi:hypothetical protein